jgi:uncharacterized Zn finger protein
MNAMFPLIYCPKCGSRMQVEFVHATKHGNHVTYECVACGGVESLLVPNPGGTSPKPLTSR